MKKLIVKNIQLHQGINCRWASKNTGAVLTSVNAEKHDAHIQVNMESGIILIKFNKTKEEHLVGPGMWHHAFVTTEDE